LLCWNVKVTVRPVHKKKPWPRASGWLLEEEWLI
jgi:hypothetical protein